MKSLRFLLAKQQLCTCITLFCIFLSRRCTTATWNLLISRTGLKEDVNTQHNNFLFLFLNLDAVLSDLTPENFPNIWQIKWNCISSMKFETVQLHFLSDVFGLVWSRNFATMATWRNDFSSLSANTITSSSPKQFHSPFNITSIHS